MTPQEAEIIRTVFDRLKAMGEGPRDAEAAGFVEARLRADPSAALSLVRALVMTDRALAESGAEIERLKRDLEAARGGAAQTPASGGGLFDGPWGRAAAPAAAPAPIGRDEAASPWGRGEVAGGPWGAPQPAGNGFWGSMVRTGVGVAGGLLAVEALKGLFGGHGGAASGPTPGDPQLAAGLFDAPTQPVVAETINVFEAPRGEPAPAPASGGFGGETIDAAAFDGEIDDIGFDDDSFA